MVDGKYWHKMLHFTKFLHIILRHPQLTLNSTQSTSYSIGCSSSSGATTYTQRKAFVTVLWTQRTNAQKTGLNHHMSICRHVTIHYRTSFRSSCPLSNFISLSLPGLTSGSWWNNTQHKQAMQEAATICPAPASWSLTLKVVSKSRVMWPTSVPILVFLGLSVLDLGQMYATDRQTETRQTSDVHHRLMSLLYGAVA